MKIFIFGPSGAGKSTVARRISKKLGVEHFDLDEIFWKFEKGELNLEKRNETVGQILSHEKWLVEGMYSDPWVKEVIKSSDKIFAFVPGKFLNYWRILRRTMPRILKIKKHVRPSNFALITYLFKIVKNFHIEKLPGFLDMAKDAKKEVFIVKSGNEIEDVLDMIDG